MRKMLVLIFLAFSFSSFTQKINDNEIVNALQRGNISQFTNAFDSFIDLKLPEKSEIKNVGKTQASITIKNFFEVNNIKSFDLISQRELGGTTYIAGKLTSDAAKYNLTVMMKNKGDKLAIITVRIN